MLNKTEEQEAINHRTKARRQSGDQRLPPPRVGRERERKLRKAFVLRNGFVLTYSSGTRYPERASSIHTTISTRPAKCKSADLPLQHAGGQDRFHSEQQADSQEQRQSPLQLAPKHFLKKRGVNEGGRGIAVLSYLTIANAVGLHLFRKQAKPRNEESCRGEKSPGCTLA